MEYQKYKHITLEKLPKFITKKWIEVHDQSGNAKYR